MPGNTSDVRLFVRDALDEFRQLRGMPTGGPPIRPGAEEMAAVLLRKPKDQSSTGIADSIFEEWRGRALEDLSIIGGQSQRGFAGFAANDAPSVRVTNVRDDPIAGLAVRCAVTGGGGTIEALEVKTDQKGIASFGKWVLGDRGDNTLTVTVGGRAVIFTAAAVTQMKAILDLGRTGSKGHTVSPAPAVKLTDYAGRPVAGIKVNFKARHGGKVEPASTTTDMQGRASCVWLLGAQDDKQTLDATAGPFTVSFTATAS